MRKIHYFENQSDFEEYRENKYSEPWVSYTASEERVDYNKIDYAKMPFTIEAIGCGDIIWPLGDKTVQYSKNGGPWETMDSETTISLASGDKVQFKGTNAGYYDRIICTARFNVFGNIMSLTDGDNYETADTVSTGTFDGLLERNTNLISAGNLILPATNLAEDCYYCLFWQCDNLTTAPSVLPATTLAEGCYDNMFSVCTKLATAPELPATTLVKNCYYCMFSSCSNLNYIKAMFTTTPSDTYTKYWVEDVAATGTFVKNSAASWSVTGDNGVPAGWTIQTASQ